MWKEKAYKVDTSSVVQESYLGTKYLESKIEDKIDLENQIRIKIFPDPTNFREAASKLVVKSKLNDPSITKNTTYFDFNDENFDNVGFIKLNSYSAIGEHATAKYCLDQSIDESTLVGKIKNYENHNHS